MGPQAPHGDTHTPRGDTHTPYGGTCTPYGGTHGLHGALTAPWRLPQHLRGGIHFPMGPPYSPSEDTHSPHGDPPIAPMGTLKGPHPLSSWDPHGSPK